jgi:hypothetical protein
MQFADADVDPGFARQMSFFSTHLLLLFAMRMTAMFVFTSSTIGKATGILPSWFAYIGYVVGILLLLSATFASWFALLFAVWVFALCIVITVSSSRAPDAD